MTTFAASVTIVDLPVGTTVSGLELFEAVQTFGGVGQSVQLSLTQMMARCLPPTARQYAGLFRTAKKNALKICHLAILRAP
jgi:hypothetical protein